LYGNNRVKIENGNGKISLTHRKTVEGTACLR